MSDRHTPSNLESVEPTVSETRAVLNNPGGAAALIKRLQKELHNTQLELCRVSDVARSRLQVETSPTLVWQCCDVWFGPAREACPICKTPRGAQKTSGEAPL